MTDGIARNQYKLWIDHVTDQKLWDEIRNICDEDILERFSHPLAFGTGGLRGRMGAGTARMNIYTVAGATQGIADYLRTEVSGQARVVIAYDSRLQSMEFARVAADVFAANGCEVYLFDRLMPTPLLSYAVRELSADAGVVITASHNPKDYNGYKVYNGEGCQIGTELAKTLEEAIQKVLIFEDIRWTGGVVKTVPESILDTYYQRFSTPDLSLLKAAYTPLNGAGREPVGALLQRTGMSLVWVEEQTPPDGHFPTCPYPNPEMPEALTLGIERMIQSGADLLLATDPDCDRVGVAVPAGTGGYRIFSGNELGVLMLDYLCQTRDILPGSVVVKTFVTTDMAKKIAVRCGLECAEVPVGFKYIGDYVGKLEREGYTERYFFGLEESCGYLPVTFVRDKDAVSASLLVCEMAGWHKAAGRTLSDAMDALYAGYGYHHNALKSYTFEGISGSRKRQTVMESFRQKGVRDWAREDFLGHPDFPVDMLRFTTGKGDTVTVRPSGTEPKMKVYISVCGGDAAAARQQAAELEQCMDAMLGG